MEEPGFGLAWFATGTAGWDGAGEAALAGAGRLGAGRLGAGRLGAGAEGLDGAGELPALFLPCCAERVKEAASSAIIAALIGPEKAVLVPAWFIRLSV